jgi:hypothetical protein
MHLRDTLLLVPSRIELSCEGSLRVHSSSSNTPGISAAPQTAQKSKNTYDLVDFRACILIIAA